VGPALGGRPGVRQRAVCPLLWGENRSELGRCGCCVPPLCGRTVRAVRQLPVPTAMFSCWLWVAQGKLICDLSKEMSNADASVSAGASGSGVLCAALCLRGGFYVRPAPCQFMSEELGYYQLKYVVKLSLAAPLGQGGSTGPRPPPHTVPQEGAAAAGPRGHKEQWRGGRAGT